MTYTSRSFPTDSKRISAPVTKKSGLYRDFGKRILDILLVIASLPITLPVIAIVALLVKMDGGPAFYSQRRIGKNGESFEFYKLRSMHVNADAILIKMCQEDPEIAHEWTTYQKLRNDPRITKVGNFIRKTSIDELPQLLNVFRGQMSIVGPRPFLPSQQLLYETANGSAYFEMRPGLTGPWQVSGRGETSFVERVNFDNEYYHKMGLWADFTLIFQTVWVVVKPNGH
ncbi:sugar transferase [Celeribacter litoreus]|uniref:sugar transferase n=1 Tax=Celeribacter litoreus TaxID=2876714 RepID=UPI001CCB0EB6|nr:sugar transferase [Celeribacter litoreus]MCA0042905.1 sugar transferase [Celeribacter litoreus]